MGHNDLRITIYSTGITPLDAFEYAHAEDLNYNLGWPGGIYLDASFFIPCDPTYLGRITQNMRIVIWNGSEYAWEGKVVNKRIAYRQGSSGIDIECIGHWGDVLIQRKWRKRWADTRISEDVWKVGTAFSGAEKCTIDRESRIRITPKSEAWTTNQTGGVEYYATTGEPIKRVTLDYDLQEGGQNWQLNIWNVGVGSLLSVTTSNATPGTRISWDSGTITATQIQCYLQAGANQTGVSDGSLYAEFANIVVYTETGSINLTEIATDVAAKSGLTDVTQIGSNTLSLVPFISEVDTLADILLNAAAIGDSSYNQWAVSVVGSDPTVGTPRIKVAQYPALTDYDIAVRMGEPNMVGSFEADQDITTLRNWIAIGYQDVNGNSVWLTPDDDANLKDTTSITAYGERQEWITVQTSSLTMATNYGRKVLGRLKDPQWVCSSGIQLQGTVRKKDGSLLPVSLIQPGMRIKVENYLNDLSGSGLTWLITGAGYTGKTQIMSLIVGRPDNIDVTIARLAHAGQGWQFGKV